MIKGKSGGFVGGLILLFVGIIIILIWNQLWSEVQGTQSILDDITLFIFQLMAGSITIGVIKIPILGIFLVISLAGIFVILGVGGRKS